MRVVAIVVSGLGVGATKTTDAIMKLPSAVAMKRGTAVGITSALPVSVDRVGAWIKGLESRGVMLVPLTTAMLK